MSLFSKTSHFTPPNNEDIKEIVRRGKESPTLNPNLVVLTNGRLRSWSDEIRDIVFELGESNLEPRSFEECLKRLEDLEESIVGMISSTHGSHHPRGNSGQRQEHADASAVSGS